MSETGQEANLADEELSRLLEAANLTQRNRARTEAMGLLDSTHGRGTLARGLSGELLARFLAP